MTAYLSAFILNKWIKVYGYFKNQTDLYISYFFVSLYISFTHTPTLESQLAEWRPRPDELNGSQAWEGASEVCPEASCVSSAGELSTV